MALSPAQRDRLIAAEGRLSADIRRRLVEYATRMWGAMGSWRDADVDRFIETLVPKVLAGQRQMAQITDAYLTQLTGSKPGGLIDVNGIRGVPDEQVYRRPATALYAGLHAGKTLDQSQKDATTRLAGLIATGLQMSKVRQAQHAIAAMPGVEAFRRVLHGPGDCALCIIASTQRYWKGTLLPIHPGCNCSVESLGRGDHREQVLDEDLLQRVHDQVESFTGSSDRGGRGPDYRKLIVVREHGEIGPLLTWKHQNFTGPNDI